METCHGCSVFIMSSLCIATTIVVLLVATHFSVTLSGSEFVFVPEVQFQRLFSNSDHNRAVLSSVSVTASHPNPFNKTSERKIQKRSRAEKIEQGLAGARISIRRASLRKTPWRRIKGDDYVASAEGLIPKAEILRVMMVFKLSCRKLEWLSNHSSLMVGIIIRTNSDHSSFVPNSIYNRSYLEMERRFKVYVYSEGDLPITHYGPCKNLYTIEGRFINEMEHGVGRFRTMDADEAHVYFMPFSVTWMVKYLYKPLSYNLTPLRQFVSDYVRVVSMKYSFWNRTLGADHFMLACHDWGPHATEGNVFLYNTSIRVLCNANTSEGFNPQKDVSLPEIHLLDGNISPELLKSPPPNDPRPHLAFFAGGVHGPIRPILLNHWKNKDNDLLIYEYLPKDGGLDYYTLMLNSKFCLCPSGYEVASPRIVEAIYAECVPVILSDHYVLPFSDVLRWEGFSIQVEVGDIPRLKEILSSVSEEKYGRLKEGLRSVRKHFVLNQPAQRFDVFHMILHSVWLRRLNLRLQ